MEKNWTWNPSRTDDEKIESFTRSAQVFRKLGRTLMADSLEIMAEELRRKNERARNTDGVGSGE